MKKFRKNPTEKRQKYKYAVIEVWAETDVYIRQHGLYGTKQKAIAVEKRLTKEDGYHKYGDDITYVVEKLKAYKSKGDFVKERIENCYEGADELLISNHKLENSACNLEIENRAVFFKKGKYTYGLEI